MDLRETIARAIDPHAWLPGIPPEGWLLAQRLRDRSLDIADQVIDALHLTDSTLVPGPAHHEGGKGMSTRRTVVNHAQLTDLPKGTILMDRMGLPVWNTDHAGWRSANGGRNIDVQLLIKDGAPFVILYKPDAEHHGLPDLAEPSDAEVEAALWAWISSAAEGVTRENVSPRVLDLNRPRARAALVAAREVAGR